MGIPGYAKYSPREQSDELVKESTEDEFVEPVQMVPVASDAASDGAPAVLRLSASLGTASRMSTGSRMSRTSRTSARVSSLRTSQNGSLQLTKDGKLMMTESTVGENRAQETLESMFFKGKPLEGTVEEDEQELDQEELPMPEVEMNFFPDPPYVLGREDERNPTEEQGGGVGVYWKDHASWLEHWPQVREVREQAAEFAQAWADAPSGARAFVNVASSAVGIRSSPTKDAAAKIGKSIKPGQCVLVEHIVEKEKTSYLKLVGVDGWVFETLNGKPVMAEMKELHFGSWWYAVICDECVEARRAPTYDNAARNGWVLCTNEIAVVSARCRVDGHLFVQLADGRGWVFALKPGVPRNNKDYENTVVAEVEHEIVNGTGRVDLRDVIPSTAGVVQTGFWVYVVGHRPVLALGGRKYGTILVPGDIVKCDKRCIASGDFDDRRNSCGGRNIRSRVWVRLVDDRGWVPLDGEDGQPLLIEELSTSVGYPSWYQGSQNLDKPQEEWMLGSV